MKKYSYLLGAAVVGLSTTASFAGVTLVATPTAINSTLASNGYVGYTLTLVADGTVSTGVSGLDITNQNATSPPGGNIGIRGNLFQQWIVDSASPDPVGFDATPTANSVPATANRVDSFFFANPAAGFQWLSQTDSPTEDNNTSAATPLADDNAGDGGFDYGVGSLMFETGAVKLHTTGAALPTTLNLAFIIVPSNVPTTIRGIGLDQNQIGWTIDTTLNPSAGVPEPASLGLLALGGVGLLIRRRRRA